MTELVTYYLEMNDPAELKAKPEVEGLDIVEAEIKDYRFNRFLYQLVGEAWNWKDQLALSDQEWQRYAERDALRTWVAYSQGAIAGYYELEQQQDGHIQIAYFGLAPKFIGKGFGGYLLTHAICSAWSWDSPKRVWVHTCNEDHPSALANYKARGFKLYKTERES